MEDERKPLVGITLGDYNGIGPEVILKALQEEAIYKYCDVVVYGNRSVLNFYAKAMKLQNLQFHDITDIDNPAEKAANVFSCWTDQVTIEPGVVSEDAGAKALLALEVATKHLVEKKIDLLVTGPVNKQTISQKLEGFKGQTEYITEAAGSPTSMMLLVDDNFRVGLVTNHVAVKDVTAGIDITTIISKLEVLNKTLKQDFMLERPKIAVLGLNPHAGDNNLIGKEEREVIIPAVNRAKERGIYAFGPFPADGFFGMHHYRKFDAVLAMYHDQGLVPFKTLTFDTGVNFTAGINVIRTSPDHGTAYDIAGKGEANANSLINAIFTGLDVVRNRAIYKEMTANPVEKISLYTERDA